MRTIVHGLDTVDEVVGRLRYQVDDPRMADFTNNLALVNGSVEHSTGFVRR